MSDGPSTVVALLPKARGEGEQQRSSFFRNIVAEAAQGSPSSRLGLRHRAGLLAPQATPQRMSPPPQLVTSIVGPVTKPMATGMGAPPPPPFVPPSPHKYNMVSDPSSRLADVLKRISPNRDDFVLGSSHATGAPSSPASGEEGSGLQMDQSAHRRVVVTSVGGMMSLQQESIDKSKLAALSPRSRSAGLLFGAESAAKAPHPYDVPNGFDVGSTSQLREEEGARAPVPAGHKYFMPAPDASEPPQRRIEDDISCIPTQEETDATSAELALPSSSDAGGEGGNAPESATTTAITAPAEVTEAATPRRPAPPPPVKKQKPTGRALQLHPSSSEDEDSPAVDFRTPFQRALAAYRSDPVHLLHPALHEVLVDRETTRRGRIAEAWMAGLGDLSRWALASVRAVKLLGQEREARDLIASWANTSRQLITTGIAAVSAELERFPMPRTFRAAFAAGMSAAAMKVGDADKLFARRERLRRMAVRSGQPIPEAIDLSPSPSKKKHHDATKSSPPAREVVEAPLEGPIAPSSGTAAAAVVEQREEKEVHHRVEDTRTPEKTKVEATGSDPSCWSFTPMIKPVELRDEPLPPPAQPLRVQFSPFRDDDDGPEPLPVSIVTPLLLTKNRGVPIVKTNRLAQSRQDSSARAAPRPTVMHLSPPKRTGGNNNISSRMESDNRMKVAAREAVVVLPQQQVQQQASVSKRVSATPAPAPTPAPATPPRGSSALPSDRSVSSSSSSSSSLSSLDAATVSDDD